MGVCAQMLSSPTPRPRPPGLPAPRQCTPGCTFQDSCPWSELRASPRGPAVSAPPASPRPLSGTVSSPATLALALATLPCVPGQGSPRGTITSRGAVGPHPVAPSITGVRVVGAQTKRTFCLLNDTVSSRKDAEPHLCSCPKVGEGPRQGSPAEGLPGTQAGAQLWCGGPPHQPPRPAPRRGPAPHCCSRDCPCPGQGRATTSVPAGSLVPHTHVRVLTQETNAKEGRHRKVDICLQLGCVQVQEGQCRGPGELPMR